VCERASKNDSTIKKRIQIIEEEEEEEEKEFFSLFMYHDENHTCKSKLLPLSPSLMESYSFI